MERAPKHIKGELTCQRNLAWMNGEKSEEHNKKKFHETQTINKREMNF